MEREAPDPDEGSALDLECILRLSVRRILREPQPDPFLAWFQSEVPRIAPDLIGRVTPNARTAFLHGMGRHIWNGVPLPDNRFRPRPLPKPERNRPCPCGSGAKYKHCCALIDAEVPNPFEHFGFLKYVLETYPRTRLKELAVEQMNAEELAYVCREWLAGGRAPDAVALLERLFADWTRLDERHEHALDTLADCYAELGKPRKKRALLEAGIKAPNAVLRGAAYQRLATVLADQGDFAGAWRAFHEAQRCEPDAPMLATLELTLLVAQGERQRAQERGRFWIARLSKRRDHDYSEVIGIIERMIESPDELFFQAAQDSHPELPALKALIDAMPPIECDYRIDIHGDEAMLQPLPKLANALQQWRRRTASADGEGIEISEAALDWLQKHPPALQSFDVIDDLIDEFSQLSGSLWGFDNIVFLPLLRRAESLLKRAIADNDAQGKRLPWGYLQHRPALRLVDRLIRVLDERHEIEEAIALAEWLVFTLNPADNQGVRERLSRLYLQAGRSEAVLALAERYPEDFAPMQYNRALALYLAGDEARAVQALNEARRNYPQVWKTLLAANPKRPPMLAYGVVVGGKDEAWLYRDEHLELWRRNGALDWAKGAVARRLPRG